MDRFMMRLSMGLPSREEEIAILQRYMDSEPLNDLKGAFTLDELAEAKAEANRTFVHPSVLGYMVSLVETTRTGEGIVCGVSPRGGLALLRAVKAFAYLDGRNYCVPDDVKAVAVPVLAHRIVTGYGQSGTQAQEQLVTKILAATPVPTETFTK